ncbi:MAG TPA: ADP-heptose synthase [Cyanobacteria bacterium UBA9971]|nr:ADP-heptose synthase [Cyanobacteria bacterium UBA9971]
MEINEKILNINEIIEYIKEQKSSEQKVVLCQGHFNTVHPGHLRFLEYAKKQGDCLIVAIQGYNYLEEKNKKNFFDEYDRARGVASLQKVDKVIIFNDISFLDVIKAVQPDFYVKGEEFSDKTDFIKDEIDLVEKLNGKVVFSSGRVEYSTYDLLNDNLLSLSQKKLQKFKEAVARQKIQPEKLNNYIDSFKDLNILVIGDTIVDEYIACDALGMSSEAPVINIKEVEKRDFVGGAAVVSRHIKSLGANCYFVSVIGNDEPANIVKKELQQENIKANLICDNERQTTFKMRYMVGNQKLLRVSRLQEHHINSKIEKQIIDYINLIADDIDGIVISDFSYGVITPNLIKNISKIAELKNIKLFGDSQSSSQIGDILKFNNFDLITPTEREARIALGDKHSGLEKIGTTLVEKLNLKNLVLTLGENGFISYQNISENEDKFLQTQHFNALNVNPVDVMGAGDSLLSGLVLGLCAGANLMEASVIGAGIASIAVSKVGNIPIKLEELKKWIQETF